jgi:fatty acid desaturase
MGAFAEHMPLAASCNPAILRNGMMTDSRTAPILDLPTLGLAAGVYLAFGLLTWFNNALPWWLVVPLGGYIVALHGSLQHEAVHGYPFPKNRWLTAGVVFPSLWLWLPFTYYREIHLAHHRDEALTCPLTDPESYYVTPTKWATMGWFHRQLRRWLTTLSGRLILGPPYTIWRAGCRLLDAVLRGDKPHLAQWLEHVPAVALVLVWVMGVCRIPLWEYLLLYVYPGLSLTLLRSFAEHRAAITVSERIATLETNSVMGLLFANNNLHMLHHVEPATVWHHRPARYRARKAELDAANGGYVIHGYGELFRKYLFRSKEQPVHPFAGQGFPV